MTENPNPTTIFAFNIHAEGIVTSTNGEPVPGSASLGDVGEHSGQDIGIFSDESESGVAVATKQAADPA